MRREYTWDPRFRNESEKNSIVDQVEGGIRHQQLQCSCGKLNVRVVPKDPCNTTFEATIICDCGKQKLTIKGNV